MLHRWLLLGFAVSLVAMSATVVRAVSPLPEVFTVNLGEGKTTCETWLKLRREAPNRALSETAWVLGYVTAAARFGDGPTRPGEPSPQRTIEHPEVDRWLDKFCAKAPFYTIFIAADRLVAELHQP
jgi:hypothetical protein